MTSTIDSVGPVLQADTAGRVRTPPERRAHLLEEFAQSGLSGAKFAALAGIRYSTFAGWVQRRRKAQGISTTPAKGTEPMRWLEAVVEQAQNPGALNCAGLVLELPGGIRAQIGNMNQAVLAAALVRALEKSC